MLVLSEITFEEGIETDRDIKIISFVTDNIQKINKRKLNYQHEWKIMEDKVFVRIRSKNGEKVDYDNFNDGQTAYETDWRTHVAFPLPMSIMKKKTADLLRNFPRPLFRSLSIDNYANLKVFEKAFEWQLDEARFLTQYLYAYIDSIIKGVGFLEVGYLEKYKEIREVSFERGEDGTEIVSPANIISSKPKRILEYDGLLFRRKDPNDVWVDQNAVELHGQIDSANLVIIKDIIDFEQFRIDFKNFRNVLAVVPVSKYSSPIENQSDSFRNEQEEENSMENDSVHLYRCYLPKTDECFYIANDKVIYDGANIYAHKRATLGMIKNVPNPGNLYSPGEIALIEHSDEVRNVGINLAIDNNKKALNPHIFITDPDIDPDEVRTQPDGVTRCKRGFNLKEALQVYHPQDVSDSALKMIELAEKEIIRVTGVDINSQFPPPSEKVTQTALKKELGNIMFGLQVKYNAANGLKDIYELAVSNFMQFFPVKKIRHFLNPEGIFKEEYTYPKVMVKDYSKTIKKEKIGGKEVESITLQESKGNVAVFEATPDIIRQQVLVDVKDNELTGDMEVMDLERFQQFVTIVLNDPELRQMIDMETFFDRLMMKYKQDPEELKTKRQIEKMESMLSEPEKELRNIKLGIEYIPPKNFSPKQHSEYLRQYMLTKDYEKESPQIINIIRDKMMNYLLESYTEGRVQEQQEEEQRQQAVKAQIQEKTGGTKVPQIEEEMGAESEARSLAQKITSNILPQR